MSTPVPGPLNLKPSQMIRFSEAILLGSTLPLCRGYFRQGEAGCLITNALKAAGVAVADSAWKTWGGQDIIDAALEQWPWLTTLACPAKRLGDPRMASLAPVYMDPAPDELSPTIEWIVAAFDRESLHISIEQIAEAIAGLEDALAQVPGPLNLKPSQVPGPMSLKPSPTWHAKAAQAIDPTFTRR